MPSTQCLLINVQSAAEKVTPRDICRISETAWNFNKIVHVCSMILRLDAKQNLIAILEVNQILYGV